MGISKEQRKRFTEAAFLAALGIAIYVGTCAKPALVDEADAANAEVGYQIARTGDWITPQSNYVPRLNKPPVAYWLIACSYELLGVSDFSARLPFALAAVGVILVTFLIGNLFSGGRTGFYSGLAAATSSGLFLFTRTIASDIVFIFFLSFGFYLFLRAYLPEHRRRGWHMMGFYACLALAVMSRGLIGLVFPILTIAAFLLVSRNLAFLREMRLLPGAILFLAITAPWHIAVGLRNPGFFYNYFINEHVLRFLGRHFPKDFRSIPVWEFWLVHFAGLFPWVFFLPGARRYWPKNYRAMSRDEQILLFLGLWAASVLLFFSVSARLEHYGLPAYPALAVIAGFVLARAADERRVRDLSRAAIPILVIGILAGAAVAVLLVVMRGQAGPANLMGEHNKLTFFSPVAGVSLRSLQALRFELVEFGAALLLMGIIAYGSIRRGRLIFASLGLAAGMVVVFAAVQAAQRQFEPYLSLKSLAVRINQEWKLGDMVAIEGEFFNMSSIGFYTRKPVYRWRGRAGWEFGSRFGNARRMFLNDAEFLRIWKSDRRVFLVADRAVLRSAGFPKSAKVLAASGTSVLISNKPAGGGASSPHIGYKDAGS